MKAAAIRAPSQCSPGRSRRDPVPVRVRRSRRPRRKQNIECVAPAHPAGNVKIRVTNPTGATGELAHAFTYVAAPAPLIFTVDPTHGPQQGGTEVGIGGQNFAPGCQILFGVGSGPAFFVDSTLVGFTTPGGPPGLGGFQIGVRNPDGQVAVDGSFFYDP